MPKFIGQRIPGSIDADTADDLVKLSYSQALKLSPSDVYRQLDTSDRGGPKSLAKRWYRWYATVEAIESCAASTPKMRIAAREVRTARISNLGRNLHQIAQAAIVDDRKAALPYRTLAISLRCAAEAAYLSCRGLLAEAISSQTDYDRRVEHAALTSVAADALEEVGGHRHDVAIIVAVAYAVGRGESVRAVGWRS